MFGDFLEVLPPFFKSFRTVFQFVLSMSRFKKKILLDWPNPFSWKLPLMLMPVFHRLYSQLLETPV